MRSVRTTGTSTTRGALGRLGALAAAATLALAGCASLGGESADAGGDGSDRDGGGTPTADGAPLLQVSHGGGFVPRGWDFARVPELTVYDDGRAVVQGPMIEIYPQPLLPNLQLHELSADDVDALVEQAREAGLLAEAPDYGMPPIADAGATTLVLTVDGESYTHTAEALGLGEEVGDALDEQQVVARQALAGFIADANDLVASSGEPTELPLETFAVMAWPAEVPVLDPSLEGGDGAEGGADASEGGATEGGATDGGGVDGSAPSEGTADDEPVEQGSMPSEIERQVLPWPVPTSLADAEQCVVVEGDEAATLLETLRGANQLTMWEQDGVTYEAAIRPLLPHEDGCDGLV
ncbi:hypothetical protein GCM10010972_14010 [Cellulomonas carbonis]|nr:hypothetical protein GCM10010972_14010 [Cellulomonas carbonis]